MVSPRLASTSTFLYSPPAPLQLVVEAGGSSLAPSLQLFICITAMTRNTTTAIVGIHLKIFLPFIHKTLFLRAVEFFISRFHHSPPLPAALANAIKRKRDGVCALAPYFLDILPYFFGDIFVYHHCGFHCLFAVDITLGQLVADFPNLSATA